MSYFCVAKITVSCSRYVSKILQSLGRRQIVYHKSEIVQGILFEFLQVFFKPSHPLSSITKCVHLYMLDLFNYLNLVTSVATID